jgi:hypothetical protein
MENGVNNHGKLMENGVTNGVDMNVKTLNTNGQNDIFNIHFPTTTVSLHQQLEDQTRKRQTDIP